MANFRCSLRNSEIIFINRECDLILVTNELMTCTHKRNETVGNEMINPLAKSSQIFDIWQMNELKNLRKHYVVLGPHWAHHQSYGQFEVEKMLEIPETNSWYFKRCNETAKVICEKLEKPLLFDVMLLAFELLFLLIIILSFIILSFICE